jgi:hypothetical protein
MFIAFPTNKFRRSVGVQCRLQVALPQKVRSETWTRSVP